MAITVVCMVFGHFFMFFVPFETGWLRVADRITVPVFLVLIGYNAGRGVGYLIPIGAVLIALSNYFLLNLLFVNILGTIILVRYTIVPFTRWAIQSKERLIATYFILTAFSIFMNVVVEYGSLSYILAMAGWMNKNREEVSPEVAKVGDYFGWALVAYLFFTFTSYDFTVPQMIVIGVGSAFVFWLLYNFKTLLLNSIKRKPRDVISHFCHFLGRKSLEVYVVHVIIMHAALFILLKNI